MCAMVQHKCFEINSTAQNMSEIRAAEAIVRTPRGSHSDISADISSDIAFVSPPVLVLYDASL
jgi:hypothetical protein